MLFKDVAHLYMGCYVWINGERSGQRILGVNHYANGVHIRLADQEYPVEYIKPEFTRPWELPTEVLEEVLKTRYDGAYSVNIERADEDYAKLTFRTPRYCHGNMIDVILWKRLNALETLILLSHGADLFNLIDSGEAIDSKTLKGEKA